MHSWWWHFWNDPMNANPWSAGAMILLPVTYIVVLLRAGRPRR